MAFSWQPPSDPVKIPTVRTRIRFPDCDPYGHLNNSRYLDYFLNAREDHLMEAYHFPLYQFSKETRRGWVVVQNQVAYLQPVFVMDEVMITSRMLAVSDNTADVEMIMYDVAGQKIKAVLWLRSVHIDLDLQRAARHAPEIQAFFTGILQPVEEQSFEERVLALRQANKN